MSKLDRLRTEISTAAALMHLRRLGATVGNNVRFIGQPIITKAARSSSIEIGDRCVLISRPEATALGVRAPVILRTLTPGAHLQLAEDTGISGAAICAAKQVLVGKRCLIGADCMIFDTDFHDHDVGAGARGYRRYRVPDWDQISEPVTIGDDVFLGTRVIVTKGVTIGNGAIIASGSIVTRDIPEHCVAAGSPAVPIKQLGPNS